MVDFLLTKDNRVTGVDMISRGQHFGVVILFAIQITCDPQARSIQMVYFSLTSHTLLSVNRYWFRVTHCCL